MAARSGLFFLLFLSLWGCSLSKSAPSCLVDQRERYYLNDELDFALEYPSDWCRTEEKVNSASGFRTVEWQHPEENGPAATSFVVMELSPSPAGGMEEMVRFYADNRPDLNLHEGESVRLSSFPGMRFLGEGRTRQTLTYFVTSNQRSFILEFSAPLSKFATVRSLFEEIAESFMILGEQPERPRESDS